MEWKNVFVISYVYYCVSFLTLKRKEHSEYLQKAKLVEVLEKFMKFSAELEVIV